MDRRIQNPVKHLRRRFLRKQFEQFSAVNYFREKLHLSCLTEFSMYLRDGKLEFSDAFGSTSPLNMVKGLGVNRY